MTDKVIIGLADAPEISELLSRKEPGDECTFTKFVAVLDEVNNQGPEPHAVLSLKDIALSGTKPVPEEDKKAPALQWAKTNTHSPVKTVTYGD